MRCWVLALALLLPVPALALSCLAPSVERSFQQFNDAAESYVVVHGRLTFDRTKLPKSDFDTQTPPKMTMIPAMLTGKSLNHMGFKVPFDQQITLEVACYGPWCGSAQDGGDVLGFLRRDAGGYALEINPCGGGAFWEPPGKMLRAVKRCFRGGNCTAD